MNLFLIESKFIVSEH